MTADDHGLATPMTEPARPLMDSYGRQARGLQNRLWASEIPALPGLRGIDLETWRWFTGFPRARLLLWAIGVASQEATGHDELNSGLYM